MEQLSRMNLYRSMMDKRIADSVLFTANVNIQVLNGVEDFFLTTDEGNEVKRYDYFNLVHRVRENVYQLENTTFNIKWDVELKVLRDNLIKLLNVYERKSAKNGRNLFNQIINELSAFNSNIIKREHFDLKLYERDDRTQVFLSHAYADRAYTWALFDYFYNRGIFLYVDWMHKDEQKDGRILKYDLKNELNKSSQLLFLRTLNSELDIQGKQYLKPWCSWELGGFYNGNNPNEKYLLNLYSVDGYQNVQYHGLKLFNGIAERRLFGSEIIPLEL